MKAAPLIVLLLAGCASAGDPAGARGGWNGARTTTSCAPGVRRRAAPLTDGADVYTWVSEGTGTRGTVSPSIGIGIGGGGGGVGIGTGVMFGSGGGEPVRCERTLIFRGGRVAEQKWLGPVEFCGGFRR
jgi:hypothetical protein